MSAMNIPMPREQLERIVRQVVRERLAAGAGSAAPAVPYAPNLVVNVSARHLHVSQADLEKLFGSGAQLTVYRWLYQPGEFASEQTVTLVGPAGKRLERVRILGPVRKATQAEISGTDAIALGVAAPVRASGDIDGTPGGTVIGPSGTVELRQGVIRAQRHAHLAPADAAHYGFRDGQMIRLRVAGERPALFEGILCRVHPNFLLEVHLDTDEGNACDLPNATGVELLP